MSEGYMEYYTIIHLNYSCRLRFGWTMSTGFEACHQIFIHQTGIN